MLLSLVSRVEREKRRDPRRRDESRVRLQSKEAVKRGPREREVVLSEKTNEGKRSETATKERKERKERERKYR